ncbi:RadC family protein [Catenovulum sediminis]|uniref:DNA repair protein RadC n=1 Tax=Catenovulum sediminis TaxID=1740262 RepID=A0ABV1RHV8_9ALTE|nr:DNA repair protein RadC [Catenovulum sediminis]
MSIKDWPAEQQPREKLINLGADALTDAELLAIFLRTGVVGLSAVDLARHLLNEFGSLRALLGASQDEFSLGKGLGAAKYCQLQACVEMTKRYLAETMKKGDALTSVEAVRNYLKACLRDLSNEVFACLFLDNQHRVIEFETLFYGTIDGASVYPRVVVEKALQKKAAALIFAHNHPSGIAEPSQADKQITQRLTQALALVDIRVLDHFIVGEAEPVSFAEMGLL